MRGYHSILTKRITTLHQAQLVSERGRIYAGCMFHIHALSITCTYPECFSYSVETQK